MQLPANATRPTKPKSGIVDDPRAGGGGRAARSATAWVVGNYETDAEVWEGPDPDRDGMATRSSATEAPLPAGAPIAGQDAVLLAVTCRAQPADCTAAGKYVDAAGHQQGLLISSSGGMWTAVATWSAPPSDANVDPNIVPSSLACADAGDCAAVGTYINPLQNSLGLLFSESGGAWAGGSGSDVAGKRSAFGNGGRSDGRARIRGVSAGRRLRGRRLVLRQ